MKAMTDLDSILKSRDITLPTKFCLIRAMVFPVVRYGCKSWTIKKTDGQRTMLSNCGMRVFWLARRVSWIARRSKQCILKKIIPEYSLEELMLKLKL